MYCNFLFIYTILGKNSETLNIIKILNKSIGTLRNPKNNTNLLKSNKKVNLELIKSNNLTNI